MNPDQRTELSLWCSKQPTAESGEHRNPRHRITVDAGDPIEWEQQPCPVKSCDGVVRRCSAPAIDPTTKPSVRARRL